MQGLGLYATLLLLMKLVELLHGKKKGDYCLARKTELDGRVLRKFSEVSYGQVEYPRNRQAYDRALAATEVPEQWLDALFQTLRFGVKSGGILLVFAWADGFTALLFVVLLGLGFWVERKNTKFTGGIWKKYRENMRRANYFSEVLLGKDYQGERKIFQSFSFFQRFFEGEYQGAARENDSLGRKRLWMDSGRRILSVALWMVFMFRTVPRIGEGAMTMGLFATLFYSLLDLLQSGDLFLANLYEVGIAKEKILDMETFLAMEEEKIHGEEELEGISTIEFRNVHFTYPNTDREILKGISFTLSMDGGGDYALIGENGSGKSTLTKLLAGLYAPTKGEILINGKEMQRYSAESLEKHIGYVAQTSYAYPGTGRESLFLGGEERNIPEELSPLAMEDLWASLPQGMETELGILSQDGVGLSGGQWQKISIARALLKERDLYILDEPNAASDPLLEAELYKVYRDFLKDKLSLMISHRLGATRNFGCILVLEEGRLRSMGSHEELIQKDPTYQELYETQRSLYDGRAS